jgi:hypothetical protein
MVRDVLWLAHENSPAVISTDEIKAIATWLQSHPVPLVGTQQVIHGMNV